MGWDDCMGAAYCRGPSAGGAGFCHALCDPAGAEPMCASDKACVEYQATFQSGTMYIAGMCDQKCNPLTDNDFLGSGGSGAQPPGSPCMTNEGCYGAAATKLPGTEFTCGGVINTDLHHRDVCAANTGNSGRGCGSRNGCAPGYVPMYYQNTGSMTVVCIAMCEPATCYSGNCGTAGANLIGKPNTPSHRCQPTDVLGNVNPAVPGQDKDQCLFNWRFEIDSMAGTFLRSPWSDTMGWCEDHSQYRYDSNNDGMFKTDGTDDPFPECAQMAPTGTGSATGTNMPGACTPANGCVGASSFGCVDTATAGLPAFQNNPDRLRWLDAHVNMPRPATDSN
jgi:hypothetical protein